MQIVLKNIVNVFQNSVGFQISVYAIICSLLATVSILLANLALYLTLITSSTMLLLGAIIVGVWGWYKREVKLAQLVKEFYNDPFSKK